MAGLSFKDIQSFLDENDTFGDAENSILEDIIDKSKAHPSQAKGGQLASIKEDEVKATPMSVPVSVPDEKIAPVAADIKIADLVASSIGQDRRRRGKPVSKRASSPPSVKTDIIHESKEAEQQAEQEQEATNLAQQRLEYRERNATREKKRSESHVQMKDLFEEFANKQSQTKANAVQMQRELDAIKAGNWSLSNFPLQQPNNEVQQQPRFQREEAPLRNDHLRNQLEQMNYAVHRLEQQQANEEDNTSSSSSSSSAASLSDRFVPLSYSLYPIRYTLYPIPYTLYPIP